MPGFLDLSGELRNQIYEEALFDDTMPAILRNQQAKDEYKERVTVWLDRNPKETKRREKMKKMMQMFKDGLDLEDDSETENEIKKEEDEAPQDPVYRFSKSFKPNASLLRVNKLVHEEAAAWLYGRVRFDFDDADCFEKLTRDIGQINAGCIRDLGFEIPEYWPASERRRIFTTLHLGYQSPEPLRLWFTTQHMWKGVQRKSTKQYFPSYLDVLGLKKIKHLATRGGVVDQFKLVVWGPRRILRRDLRLLTHAEGLGFEICRETRICRVCREAIKCTCDADEAEELLIYDLDYPYDQWRSLLPAGN